MLLPQLNKHVSVSCLTQVLHVAQRGPLVERFHCCCCLVSWTSCVGRGDGAEEGAV